MGTLRQSTSVASVFFLATVLIGLFPVPCLAQGDEGYRALAPDCSAPASPLHIALCRQPAALEMYRSILKTYEAVDARTLDGKLLREAQENTRLLNQHLGGPELPNVNFLLQDWKRRADWLQSQLDSAPSIPGPRREAEASVPAAQPTATASEPGVPPAMPPTPPAEAAAGPEVTLPSAQTIDPSAAADAPPANSPPPNVAAPQPATAAAASSPAETSPRPPRAQSSLKDRLVVFLVLLGGAAILGFVWFSAVNCVEYCHENSLVVYEKRRHVVGYALGGVVAVPAGYLLLASLFGESNTVGAIIIAAVPSGWAGLQVYQAKQLNSGANGSVLTRIVLARVGAAIVALLLSWAVWSAVTSRPVKDATLGQVVSHHVNRAIWLTIISWAGSTYLNFVCYPDLEKYPLSSHALA